MATFRVNALVLYKESADDMAKEPIYEIVAYARCVNADEAITLAASFPKYCRMRPGSLSGDPGYTAGVAFHVWLNPDGVNKGINEAGRKRLQTFFARAEWEYVRSYTNCATREQFDALVREIAGK